MILLRAFMDRRLKLTITIIISSSSIIKVAQNTCTQTALFSRRSGDQKYLKGLISCWTCKIVSCSRCDKYFQINDNGTVIRYPRETSQFKLKWIIESDIICWRELTGWYTELLIKAQLVYKLCQQWLVYIYLKHVISRLMWMCPVSGDCIQLTASCLKSSAGVDVFCVQWTVL